MRSPIAMVSDEVSDMVTIFQNLGCVIIFSLFRTLFGLLSNVYGIHFFLVNCFIVRGEEMYISFVL